MHSKVAKRCVVNSPMEKPSYHYIEDKAGLDGLIEACRTVEVVSVDTEFERSSTYYPIVGLIQVYTGDDCFVIDPVAIEDLSPLMG